jgi:hypothetical protein
MIVLSANDWSDVPRGRCWEESRCSRFERSSALRNKERPNLSDPTIRGSLLPERLKPQVRRVQVGSERLKRLKVDTYKAIHARACASHIEAFSRFSRCPSPRTPAELLVYLCRSVSDQRTSGR